MTTDKKTGIHTRIIWCCAWSHDSKYFATCSRDGKAIVWTKNENSTKNDSCIGQYEAIKPILELKEFSITAVAFAPVFVGGSYLLSFGFEHGEIRVYKWSSDSGWIEQFGISQRYFSLRIRRMCIKSCFFSFAHHKTVKRLLFNKPVKETDEKVLQLASCSSDHSVKVHNIYIDS